MRYRYTDEYFYMELKLFLFYFLFIFLYKDQHKTIFEQKYIYTLVKSATAEGIVFPILSGRIRNLTAELSSLCLFISDNAYTSDTVRIDRYRDSYISMLKKYSENRKPKRTQIVAKILSLITEIQTLDSIAKDRILTNVKKRGELSDLLCEMWDMSYI